MTSWLGTRQFAQSGSKSKTQESVSFFQTTEGGFCSNFTQLFLAYADAVKNSSPLYVHDVPSAVGPTFPLLQTILKDNSTVKYLKDIPQNSQRIDPSKLSTLTSVPVLRRMARDLFMYNGDTQEKIMTRIKGAGLERTQFDVGVHIRSGDKITTGEMKAISIDEYVRALSMYSRKLGKKLSIFVMTDNITLFEELKQRSDPSWSFTTLQGVSNYTLQGHTQYSFTTLPSAVRQDLFYQFLTELHILQNIPNLVVTYSSNIGRFLYLTSRFQHTSDSIISLDVPVWSLV